MKTARKITGVLNLLFIILLGIILFASCGGDQGTGKDDADSVNSSFFIDWQDGGFKKEYGLLSVPENGDWYATKPVERKGYILKGVYSEKNGQGERLFDSVGNRLSEPEKGKTYYAYWEADTVSVSFRFANDNSSPYCFTDGSKRICKLYKSDDAIDFVFPESVGTPEVLYWRSGNTRISDGNVLYSQYKTIADLITDADSNYVNIYPVFATPDYTVTLTLDYGSRVENVELTYGDDIAEFLVTYTQGDRELVGWTADRYDDEELIENPEPIKADTTLYAVWHGFTEITLYGVDENYFEEGYVVPSEESRDNNPFCFKRIYEYRPEYLATPQKDGYVFAGWYASPDFSGQPISRLISRDVNSGSYYAKWIIAEWTINVRYDTGNGMKTVKVVLRVDETLRLKADLSALKAPSGKMVIRLLKSGVPCTDENGYWTDGASPSPDYTAYYGAEVG